MRSFIAIAAICAVLTGYPAFADDSANQQSARIEIDQVAKAFIFIIDDKPVAMLDQQGLHVEGEINYGATLKDEGNGHLKKRVASQVEVADD